MTRKLSRRQVLSGASGFTLALPFLPSLARRAEAAPLRRRFVAFGTGHGGVKVESMYPASPVLTDRQTLFGSHEIRWGRLQRQVQGSNAALSRVVAGPANKLTERLTGKMNILRGLDIPFNIDHHKGGHLGNYASHSDAGEASSLKRPQPSIDQVLAWSKSFYPDVAAIRERALVIGRMAQDGSMSFNHSSPATKTGDIVAIGAEHDAARLFGKLFTPGEPVAPGAPARPPVVDRVLATYKSLRESHTRLSAEDRQRLDDHMERLAELQRRVNVSTGGAQCGTARAPTVDTGKLLDGGAAEHAQFYAVMNDLLVAAFLCDATRVASIVTARWFVPFSGDWHKDVAHKADDGAGAAQATMVASQQRSFELMMLDLISKMDVEEAPGVTLLDNSLVMWSQESGQRTHDGTSRPVVTAGSAGGYFKTGLYVDYQNLTRRGRYDKTGLLYGQYLWNVLMAMGLPASEVKRPGNHGYGIDTVDRSDIYEPGVFTMAFDKLPIVT